MTLLWDNPAYYQGVDEATKTELKWFQNCHVIKIVIICQKKVLKLY